MKKLKKILLINWLYFSKQVIEVEDVNFLTGKNGAGKSTVIDALQIVLLGELNARNFNKAANESSQRTLDGYLRADMDPQNPKSRRGKDFSSYIACEFWDEQEGKQFVIGIVFDCRSDGSRQERFFTYDGVIPEHYFVVEKQTMDITALRSYLKALPGSHGILYDSNKQYRTDVLAKWNVHNEQVCRMLKKAVSFRPIVDIQQFITENICDIPEKPDIELMQQNIRDYKRHEELAKRQEEKLVALDKIGKLFQEMRAAIDRFQLQSFLVLWAEKEDLGGRIDHLEQERETCRAGIRRAVEECENTEALIGQKNARRDELKADQVSSDVFQEQNRIEARQHQLSQEQGQLEKRLSATALEVRREAEVLDALCGKIAAWPEAEELAPLQAAAHALQRCCGALRHCAPETLGGSPAPFEAAQAAAAGFSARLRDAAYALDGRLDKLQEELDENEGALEKLRRNVKDYPAGLLALKRALEHEVSGQAGSPVKIEILADLLEIAEGQEHWRGAVEGYLNTQKFYLLVAPEHYEQALAAYDRMKREYGKTFGLVDVGKLRERERLEPWNDSLAKKVETANPLARDYINYLLGRVVCCAHTSQLRRNKIALTAEGMVYQGYVARPLPKERMEDAFIGRKAVALRIRRLQDRQQILSGEIQTWAPLQKELDRQRNREYLLSQRFLQGELAQRQADFLRALEIAGEIQALEEELSHLDLLWLGELKAKIDALEQEIHALNTKKAALSEEKGGLEKQLHFLEYERLPELYQKQAEKKDALAEKFSESYQNKVGLPRYEQELARLRRAGTVAKNFGDQLVQRNNEVRNTQRALFQARSDYVRTFQPCTFRVETMDNEEFDAERRLLEESELPRYREKIQKARESALEQFQNDFLAKLKSSIDQVKDQVNNLNRALKRAQFGTDQYQFRVDRNPDYAAYYDMITAPELMEGESGLFAVAFQEKYGPLIEELFGRIATADDTQLNARRQSELQENIQRFTDFRTYLKFDLETTDRNGNRQLLSQTLNTKSGGETQTPFYIAVLASFAQLYQVNNLSGVANNTVRLVVFDEAFNKMDSDRIIESVRLLRKMHLQAIICTPPDKIPDIAPEADCTLLVRKNKYKMQILRYGKEISPEWNEA